MSAPTAPTFGPWNVARASDGTLQPFDKDGRHLLSGKGDNPLPQAEREANAILMSMAPYIFAEYKVLHARVTAMARALHSRRLGAWVNDWLSDGILSGDALSTVDDRLAKIDVEDEPQDDDVEPTAPGPRI